MSIDAFSGLSYRIGDPAIRTLSISPHDVTELQEIPKAVYVGGSGDVVLRAIGDDSDVTFKAVPTGTIIPLRVQYIRNTGTTATFIVGLI